MFHRIALRTKGRIAQAWTTVFIDGTITKSATTVTAAIIAWATPAGISTATITALTRAPTTARSRRRVFLHARTVIATHRNHRPSRLGWCHRGGGGSFRNFTAQTIGHSLRFNRPDKRMKAK